MKVAIFSAKSYDEESLQAANAARGLELVFFRRSADPEDVRFCHLLGDPALSLRWGAPPRRSNVGSG
jgi:hypothetical protein